MSRHASTELTDRTQRDLARTILCNEAQALFSLADRLGADQLGADQLGADQLGADQLGEDQLGEDQLGAEGLGKAFCRAVRILLDCEGNVLVAGMGKAGLIGQKIMATLSSTGTPSHFVHPAEALHGDLGRFRRGDCAILLSNSGTTEEVVRLLPSLAAIPVPVIGVTSHPESPLGGQATVCLELGVAHEACTLGLAPSTSTTAMLALGDALALVTSHLRGFCREDFARYHPGGSLGLRLAKVAKYTRTLDQCCVAEDSLCLRDIFTRSQRPRRRSGAVLLTDGEGRLSGIFTDSDLARLFETKQDAAIDRPVREVMTHHPIMAKSDTLLVDAIKTLVSHKISELPVVDPGGYLVGLLDITDVLGLLPRKLVEPCDGESTSANAQEAGGKEAGGKEAGGKEAGGKEAGGKEAGNVKVPRAA